MSGFFGVASKEDCIFDLFFGTDYHSHLGTRRAGMTVYHQKEGFHRAIHNIENTPFRTKFDKDLNNLSGHLGIGCISDYEPQPLLIRSHHGTYAIMTIGKINNIDTIVSDEGYGKNDYIETTRPLVIVTAPGPGSGKMATCLSQLYHENKNGIKAGYAKFETFPIWNIPLKHPVNLAYEAATADLNDVNMIDPFHLEAYGETTVNYNRDIEIYPVLAAMFERIYGHCPYKSPTDMGVNMAGNCIIDDEACREASRQEIIRRYYQSLNRFVKDEATNDEIYKQELIMKQAKITVNDRIVVPAANDLARENGSAAAALELPDGSIVTGSTSDLLGPASAVLLNAIKVLGNIDKKEHLISRTFIEPIQQLKTGYLGSRNPRLHTDEVLIALSMCAVSDSKAKLALEQLPKLSGCQLHVSAILSAIDTNTFKKLGIECTTEAVYEGASGN